MSTQSGGRRSVLAMCALAAMLAIAALTLVQDVREVSAAKVWTIAGHMSAARFDHTGTSLANGDILVAGGKSTAGDASLSSARLYDYSACPAWQFPPVACWFAVPGMSVGRVNHTATLMSNDKVLVTGGVLSPGVFLASAEVYDPSLNMWSPAAGMAHARAGHTATALANGLVLVTGGSGTSVAELYDPVADTWTAAALMPEERIQHQATLLADGRVLLTGGVDLTALPPGPLNRADIYDPVADAWVTVTPSAVKHQDHVTTVLLDGRVLLTDYLMDEVYDPVADSWSGIAAPSLSHQYHTATRLTDGTVLVAGGGATQDGSERYDPTTNTWAAGPVMSDERAHHTANLLPNGNVVVAGGWTGVLALAVSERYEEQPAGPPTPTPTATPTPIGDADGDGVLDANDNCPFVSNPSQLNTDRNFVDTSPPYVEAVDDKTWPNSDAAGDECDLDDDNDGISDAAEATGAACGAIVTNPLLPDTDGDRALDGAECALETNPTLPLSFPAIAACGAAGDADGDKISNRVEFCYYGTNPASTDSDGDAVGGLDGDGGRDGCEVASINADQVVSSGDQGKLASGIAGAVPYHPGTDLDKSGVLNSGDQGLMASFISPPSQCPG